MTQRVNKNGGEEVRCEEMNELKKGEKASSFPSNRPVLVTDGEQ